MKLKLTLIALLLCGSIFAQQAGQFRPPSVPLVTHDPYFSIWSPSNNLWDRETVHWTGTNHPMHCIIRIDGNAYRIMGSSPSYLKPLTQVSLKVLPTSSIYEFRNEMVSLKLSFISPLLPSDLDIMSRPVTYVEWDVKSNDGRKHDVQLYFDVSSEIAVNTTDQQIVWDYPSVAGLNVMRVGTRSQQILGKSGDNLRIDWGYAYLAAPSKEGIVSAVDAKDALQNEFIKSGKITRPNDAPQPRKVNDRFFAMSYSMDLGKVGSKSEARTVMVGYDDIYSIRYFDTDLRPWWRRNGMDMEQLLVKASDEYAKIKSECEKFDSGLMKDLTAAGGSEYAQMCALAYRQSLAAHKLAADANGKPLIFAKENFSNGCIATVDVIYPASPLFFLFSPALTKAMLKPLLDYSASPKWKFAFAPHDLGTYPYATGQVYGGGEETEEDQMPVEETGNMVIMMAALAKVEGNAGFAKDNWSVLEKWAGYLLSKGFDPENQLCTDDFAGHLAHNINLSAKAIVAIGSYSMLCDMLGMKDKAKEFRSKAEAMVKEWIKQAADGDHTKLAFDRPGTWSQKYNIIWDKVLGLNLFPKSVIDKEISFYKKQQAQFGLPLDSRQRYTKNDWITWTASLAYNMNDFKALFNPVYKFADKTPNRVPLSDWYITDNAYQVGFQARSVVGGFFMKMLTEKNLWKKWSAKGTDVTGEWAPLKFLKFGKTILPTAREEKIDWTYTTVKPADGWMNTEFNDSDWDKGPAGFGPKGYFNTNTEWLTTDIYIRNTFNCINPSDKGLALIVNWNDDAEIYLNGKLLGSYSGACSNYTTLKLGGTAKQFLRKGNNVIAIHCKWTDGNRYIDAGLKEYDLN